ncbi:MAG: hypothetical protein LBQ90_00815 [Synergistaceae bacterium]|jgi:hypothetical protein|nr:hypothetical protein [Synergistaceae bacterium]
MVRLKIQKMARPMGRCREVNISFEAPVNALGIFEALKWSDFQKPKIRAKIGKTEEIPCPPFAKLSPPIFPNQPHT